MGILDGELVTRRVISERGLEARPRARDARVDAKRSSADAEAEDPLDARPVHPAGRSRVPGPAAAADVRRLRVDVAPRDVRLDLVAVQTRRGSRVVDRVQEREELARAIAVTERRERDDGPDRAVRVLPAVLADSRRVPLDVAGVERRLVEGRGEEEDEPVAAPHEVLVHGRHRASRAGRVRRRPRSRPRTARSSRSGTPRRGRSERRPVVEEGAPIPVAVPASRLDRGFQRSTCSRQRGARSVVSAPLRERRELVQVRVEEPREPDALPLPSKPTRFMPSFQSPDPIRGRPCAPDVRLRSSARAQCSNRSPVCPCTRQDDVELSFHPDRGSLGLVVNLRLCP